MSARRSTRAASKRGGKDVPARLTGLADQAVQDIMAHRNPSVSIPVRSLANVTFDPKKSIIELGDQTQSRALFNVGQARKFMQTFLIASGCKGLLDAGKTTS